MKLLCKFSSTQVINLMFILYPSSLQVVCFQKSTSFVKHVESTCSCVISTTNLYSSKLLCKFIDLHMQSMTHAIETTNILQLCKLVNTVPKHNASNSNMYNKIS